MRTCTSCALNMPCARAMGGQCGPSLSPTICCAVNTAVGAGFTANLGVIPRIIFLVRRLSLDTTNISKRNNYKSNNTPAGVGVEVRVGGFPPHLSHFTRLSIP